MTLLLCSIFFVSGASALVFETLWFQQAGLAFGNSIWSSSLVLAAFMAGLALGNAAAARYGQRLARPIRVYALLEVAIAATGLALVLALPELGPLLGAWLRPLLDSPWLLNPLRLLAAFFLLLVPATAMGATLPLMVRELSRSDPHFARVLGRLYGWNTIGAVLGALAGEAFLIGSFGIRGSAVVAALLNLTAAGLALAAGARAAAPARAPEPAPRATALDGPANRLLGVAFLAGLALLALEVVWFRFLLLFMAGTSLAFALMLAVVLAGIATGGLLASRWRRSDARTERLLPVLAWTSGALLIVTYQLFLFPLRVSGPYYIKDWPHVLLLGLALMFPVSLISGSFFTLVGTALQTRLGAEARSTGLLTFANTAGAALGSLLAGFVLLPIFGMEVSFFLLAMLYGLIGLSVPGARGWISDRPAQALASGGALLLLLAVFPFGLMERGYLMRALGGFVQASSDIVAVRESATDTIIYTREERHGETYFYRLITNGYSMSGTGLGAQRYMKLYVNWPVALHPGLKQALLISYGVGNTARALTATRSFERIDVVDISRDILEMSEIVYPDPAEHPLHDPRVHVHIEDGRYFLQSTDRRYDLITGEPPPPQMAGIVSLYTLEYFSLIRERLADGGMATYWLPVQNLTAEDTKAILQGFCVAFDDCSLWLGTKFNWMLVGTRNAEGPVSSDHFARQWQDPQVGAQLRAIAVETPAQLGALFVADADQIADWIGETPPLSDNWPHRLSPSSSRRRARSSIPLYEAWIDPSATLERFRESSFVRSLWPPELREATLSQFGHQGLVNELSPGGTRPPVLETLHDLLAESELRTLPLWLMGTDDDELRIVEDLAARGSREPVLSYRLGQQALAERDFETAAQHMRRALRATLPGAPAARLVAYALSMAGDPQKAAEVLRRVPEPSPPAPGDVAERHWLVETFALPELQTGTSSEEPRG